jgi:molybdopterin synthase catalytic subunit
MISITEKPIDVSKILEETSDDSAGATALFIGTVRNHNEEKNVSGIQYEAYKEMAHKVLLEIENEVMKKWNIKKLVTIHRIGNLKVRDISVIVAVSTEHRKEAFEACRYTIDKIKTRVPIWKKEKADYGEHWVENISK